MRTLARSVAALIMGLLLLVPLGAFYGAAHLPVYHSWGLAHGSFTTALPALVLASFVFLGLVPWFGKSQDAVPRAVACVSVLVLVTALFWADQRSQYAMSMWHLAVYVALFVLFAVLCRQARGPMLIPLFLLVPMLIDPLFGLITSRFDTMDMEIFGDLLFKILPAAVATGLAAVIATFSRVGAA